MEPLKFVLQGVQLGIRQLFHLHQRGTGRLYSANQFVQFQMNYFRVSILRVLNQENYEESAQRSSRVDNQLPSIGVMKTRARHTPDDDTDYGEDKGPRRANRLSGQVRELPKDFLHGNRLSRNCLIGPQGRDQCVTGS